MEIKEERNYVLYQILNRQTGHCYIGITKDFKRRMYVHRTCNDNYKVHRAINKYGWDSFDKEIILDNLTQKEALAQETLHCLCIKYLEKLGFGKRLNIQDGGGHIGKYDEDCKQRMSKSQKEHYKNNPERNIKLSERHKEILRKDPALKDKRIENLRNPESLRKLKKIWETPEYKQKHRDLALKQFSTPEAVERARMCHKMKEVVCVGTGIIYNSIKETARQFGVDTTSVVYSCKHKTINKRSGSFFRFKEDLDNEKK